MKVYRLLSIITILLNNDLVNAKYLAEKCINLRIYEDEAGKMNISGLDFGAEILAISQFTLYGDTRKGRRPSFIEAAPPEVASHLFDQFVEILNESGLKVESGQFQAKMAVSLVNDGPVTIILDSKDKPKK